MCLTNGENEHIMKGCYSVEKDVLLKDLCTRLYMWSTCNKLLRRSLINDNTIFPQCNFGEDMAFIIPLVLKAEHFSYVPGSKYYYFYNSDSLTKVDGEEITLSKYKMLLQNVEIVVSSFTNAGLSEKYIEIIDVLKFGPKKVLWGLTYNRKYFKLWQQTYHEINHRVLFNKYIKKKDKLAYCLTYLHLYPSKKSRVPMD